MREINLIDIEASGLGLDSYPVEIAVFANGKMYSWLIKPEPAWQHWDRTAEGMHGITRELLDTQGKQVRFVADAINAIMTDSNGLLYSDAPEWDQDWINTLFHAAGAIPEFHILPVSDLLTDTELMVFKCNRDEIATSGKYRRHRAEPDIHIIQEALAAAFSK